MQFKGLTCRSSHLRLFVIWQVWWIEGLLVTCDTRCIYQLNPNTIFNKHKIDQYFSEVSPKEAFDEIGPIESELNWLPKSTTLNWWFNLTRVSERATQLDWMRKLAELCWVSLWLNQVVPTQLSKFITQLDQTSKLVEPSWVSLWLEETMSLAAAMA